MAAWESIGPIVGSGSATNTKSITITLDEPVPATSFHARRGVAMVIACAEPLATAALGYTVPEQNKYKPIVTDSLTGASPNPYTTKPNGNTIQLPGGFIFTHGYYRSATPTVYLFRDAPTWEVFNRLEAGNTITIDYSNYVTVNFDWIHVNVHTFVGSPPRTNVYSRVQTGRTSAPKTTGHTATPSTTYSTFRWCQTVGGAMISQNTADVFTMVGAGEINMNQQYVIDYSGVRFSYAFHDQDDRISDAPLKISVPGGSGNASFQLMSGGDYYYAATVDQTVMNSRSQFLGEGNPGIDLKGISYRAFNGEV